ncbi:galactokinase [Anaerobiospirillum thomasii]|uniref:Galactokinase n=1 Tax=Anaerobiospirillum thomasii TaxID=179995 RepID=A0A2X0VPG2_9GAMM|nr:galactokinase [Anaerobiospirillum thomasii]SPT69640.1 Galactokinase [Anaerobiospirillum thomasii]
MTDVKHKAIEAFKEHFKKDPTMLSYAPGRVNLIGEHTDYNDGFVLPCAIKFGTAIAAAKRDDNKINALALDINGDCDEFEITANMDKHESKTWSNYLRGVVKLICEKGYNFGGLDIVICGDVPLGAGLSSSASLEVCFGNLLSKAYGLNIALQDIALIGQAAEAFIGCKCGIMDQTISACGHKNCALKIDCRSLKLEQVPVPESLEVLIVNSNVKHALVGGEYNERREQCEKAAQVLGVKALRDATMEMLKAKKAELDDVTFRRARHVITEDDRVIEAVDAFSKGDLKRLAKLMYASHVSMRDDFEITIKEIDALVEIIREAIGEDAAVRMTGGGFGGSVVAVVEPSKVEAVTKAIDEKYEKIAGRKATIFATHATDGASFQLL